MSYGQLLDSDLYCYAEERDANGSLIGYGWKLRTKEETDSIRQQRITQQEDVVLAAAEMIRMRRKHESKDTSEDTDTMQTLTNALGLSREAYYALKEARIGLRMWGMATKKIDDIIGPMTEQERDKAREARGAPLPDDNDPPDEMVDIKTKMKVFFYDGYVRPTVGSKHPVEVILLISEENIASAATRAKQHALENHYTFPDGYQLKITEFDTSKPFITTIKK